MLEITRPIGSDSYTAKPAVTQAIVTALPGGLPRVELDMIGGYMHFDCIMEVHRKEYKELQALYNTFLETPQPVRVKLVSMGLLRNHTCIFVPGTWTLQTTDAWDNYRIGFSLVGAPEL